MSNLETVDLQQLDITERGTKKRESHTDDDYDPHLHRNVSHPTSDTATLVHILKGSLGTGILAMPQAFSYAGYASGLISIVVIGYICTYCLHVLIRSQYILCKKHRLPILSYPISMKMALEEGPPCLRIFAPAAIVIVDGFMIIYQLGICCVYIVFVAENIENMLPISWGVTKTQIICLLLLPLILLNMIRNLKVLAPFSTAANIITFVGIGLLFYYILDDVPDISTRNAGGSPLNFALFFGTTLFALEAVGVVVAVENNMETPKSFYRVINIGMIVIVILYAAVGFLGYLKYGDDAKGTVTLNTPEEDVKSMLIRLLFAIATFISYGLQVYVPVEIIWHQYLAPRLENNNKKNTYEYVTRLLIVLATFIPAVLVPRLSLFITLFGALCLSVLGIVFPAVMEVCVLWPNGWGRFNYVLHKNIILSIIGVAGLIIGTYKSINDIIVSFQ